MSDHADLVLAIATAPSPNTFHWSNSQIAWRKFLASVENPASVKECGNYVFGELAPTLNRPHKDCAKQPCAALHRNRDAVTFRSAVTLDVDYPDGGFLDRVEALGVETVVHTTFSSTPDALRYRVVLPTDNKIAPDDYRRLARHLMRELGENNFDPGSSQPERYMFRPSVAPGQTYRHWRFSGELLNVDLLLLDASLEEPEEAVERPERAEADISTPPTEQEREKAASTLAKAVRYAPDLRNPDGEFAPGRNQWVTNWGTPLLSLVKGGSLDLKHVEDALWEASLLAPDSGFKPWTREEFDGVCESVWGYVVPTRPKVESAIDVFTPVLIPDSTHIPVGNFIDPRDGLMAQVLANRVGKYLMCAVGELDDRFYIYNDGVWKPGARQIGTVVSLLLGDRYRQAHLSTVKDKIRYDPTTATIDCGPTPRWINCRNGLLDWRTGKMANHTPDVLSVTQLPVEWNPDAECPNFEVFIRQVLPPDCVDPMDGGPGLIWEMLGYFLYSGNPHHVAVLLRGKGRNGKGVLLRVLERLLGTENVSAVTLSDLTENRFRAADLYGKLANIAGDLDPKWLSNTATFKAITGGDTIAAEHKYGQAFGFTPWSVPIYSANKVFGSADSSEGYFARWFVLPFPNSFLGREDRNLDARLGTKAELEGVLRRSAQALPALMKRGRLPEPESVKVAKHEFIVGGDRVRAWIHEYYKLSPDGWTNRSDMYDHFSLVADYDTRKPMSRSEFYNRLDGIDGLYDAKRKGVRGFRGIRLQTRGGREGAGAEPETP